MGKLLAQRDLIVDRLGNYYEITGSTKDKKIILVNAVIYYSNNRILHEDHFEEHKGERLTAFFIKMLENRIEGLKTNKYPGSIFTLESLESEGYEFVANNFHCPPTSI